ncbi:subunit G of V-type proton ATPase [Chloropicon roscoffensis]|uniref:V-type proton ATPase subunit G n=1 Tax=Chloropicon roscoffensis TaxID=1461544 RepID=A0A7S2X4C8_9CHLO|mmetsp:Transcript_5375/g.16210  ORF Transcript_5375/g.16210 Transcript_5375/m.16210 type:complete len:106 (+) Transcript_5375:213-530(+)
MASNTHIGELLKAEEEAVATVTAARKEKTDLLRQATAEADREVLAYRQQLEQQYQAMLQQGGADTKGNLVRLEQETGRTIESMKQRVQQKSQQVANILVDHVKRT